MGLYLSRRVPEPSLCTVPGRSCCEEVDNNHNTWVWVLLVIVLVTVAMSSVRGRKCTFWKCRGQFVLRIVVHGGSVVVVGRGCGGGVVVVG